MRLRLSALLSALLLIGGCTSTSYDLLETASVSKPKFSDTDPQDFGVNNPHRHEVHGIDVSKWNGDVDWQTVRKSGVSFVFIKATEGSDRIDPKFGDHCRSAAAANILHAPYHFYYFCSTADAQADWFIRNVPKDAVTLPPVLDVEWNPASPTCKTRPAPGIVRAEMQRFLDRIEARLISTATISSASSRTIISGCGPSPRIRPRSMKTGNGPSGNTPQQASYPA